MLIRQARGTRHSNNMLAARRLRAAWRASMQILQKQQSAHSYQEDCVNNGKKIIIIAGPNGAGKTTFARSFLPAEAGVLRFINADLIAAGLSPFEPEAAAIKAGRLMLEEVKQSVADGASFALETTLSGHGYLRHIRRWQTLGYRVSLYFLSLSDADTAVARVAERVRQGGHHIPEPVIRRRFIAGMKNFIQHYRQQVDDWALYDNSGSHPILLEWGENS